MIEIDHTAPPKPEPAKPILASHLLAVEEKQRKRFAERGERIKTGCEELDGYVLGGGFERGIVVGLSSEGNEGRLISLNLLTTILLSHLPLATILPRKPIATIIDTTGSFPISLLASILASRLSSTSTLQTQNQVTSSNHPVRDDQPPTINVEKEVQRCLEMVAISRVFDIEGLWEVLGEIGRGSPHKSETGGGIGDFENLDSQRQAETANPPHAHNPASHQTRRKGDIEEEEKSTEIIIVDNMHHIITELFSRKAKSDAHTLLTLLSNTLHTLTQSLNILTLLHNSTVSSISTYPPQNQPQNQNQNHPPTHPPRPKPQQRSQITPSSVFTANPLKPALGRIFNSFTTLHIFLSHLPRTKEDAELLYAHDDSSQLNMREVNYCTIIEILKDETPNLSRLSRLSDRVDGEANEKGDTRGGFGMREQRWCAVLESPDGLGFVSAFPSTGNSRNVALDLKEGEGHDVGSIAKIYGFGGRRV